MANLIQKPRSVLYNNTGNDTVNASSTEFSSLISGGSWNASELNRATGTSKNGTLRDFYLVSTTAEPASGSLICTVRKNQIDTALVITVPAGSAAGIFYDTTNTVSIAVGDTLGIKGVKAGTSASCTTRFGIYLYE